MVAVEGVVPINVAQYRMTHLGASSAASTRPCLDLKDIRATSQNYQRPHTRTERPVLLQVGSPDTAVWTGNEAAATSLMLLGRLPAVQAEPGQSSQLAEPNSLSPNISSTESIPYIANTTPFSNTSEACHQSFPTTTLSPSLHACGQSTPRLNFRPHHSSCQPMPTDASGILPSNPESYSALLFTGTPAYTKEESLPEGDLPGEQALPPRCVSGKVDISSPSKIDLEDVDASEGDKANHGPRKRMRLSSEERLQRSRERNRLHARKTRKRKKVQMESIQQTIERLTEEGRRMRLALMEWYTANILIVMRGPDGNATPADSALLCKYMEVQAFLDRSSGSQRCTEQDSSPTEQASSPQNQEGDLSKETSSSTDGDRLPDDMSENGLEGQCKAGAGRCPTKGKHPPEERERIRRERNRIHAKRTRDRRRKFMVDSENVLAGLTKEDEELRHLLDLVYRQDA